MQSNRHEKTGGMMQKKSLKAQSAKKRVRTDLKAGYTGCYLHCPAGPTSCKLVCGS